MPLATPGVLENQQPGRRGATLHPPILTTSAAKTLGVLLTAPTCSSKEGLGAKGALNEQGVSSSVPWSSQAAPCQSRVQKCKSLSLSPWALGIPGKMEMRWFLPSKLCHYPLETLLDQEATSWCQEKGITLVGFFPDPNLVSAWKRRWETP